MKMRHGAFALQINVPQDSEAENSPTVPFGVVATALNSLNGAVRRHEAQALIELVAEMYGAAKVPLVAIGGFEGLARSDDVW